MMGEKPRSEPLFYYFRLEDQIPEDHLLKHLDQYVDFSFVRGRLKDAYSRRGRPSIDPEILLRMLLVGYLYGITSERRLGACPRIEFNAPGHGMKRRGFRDFEESPAPAIAHGRRDGGEPSFSCPVNAFLLLLMPNWPGTSSKGCAPRRPVPIPPSPSRTRATKTFGTLALA